MIIVLDITFFHSLWNFLLCNIFSSQGANGFPRNLPLSHFRTVSVHDVPFFPPTPLPLPEKKGGRTRRELDRERLLPLFPFPPDLYFPFFSSLLTFPVAPPPPPPPPPPLPSRERRSGERGRKQSSLSLSFPPPSEAQNFSPSSFPVSRRRREGEELYRPFFTFISLSLSLSLSLSPKKCLASSGTLCAGDCRSKDGGDFGIPSKVYFLFPGKRPPPRLRTPRRTRSSWPRCW